MPGQCFKVSNNKFFNCPALMSDGRTFTDYRANCYVNNTLLSTNNINSSFQYRQWLIQNATKLMNNNKDYNKKLNGCQTCDAQNIPVQSVCVNNGFVPKCSVQDNAGLGTQYIAGNIPTTNYSPALQESFNINNPTLANSLNPSFVSYAGVPGYMCGSR